MFRRAALYGAPTSGAGWQKCYSALFLALETRFGKNRIWRRTTRFIEKDDVADDVAVAIILGVDGCAPEYAKRCRELGIPTLVVSEGWLRLERGFWQVSPGWVDVAPPTAPDSKRFEALNLMVHPVLRKDYGTVIIGEVAGDQRHDLLTDDDVVNWARSAAGQVPGAYPGRHRIYWRPHPNFVRSLGRPTILTQHDRVLSDFLKMSDVGSAVVYNSPVGVDLLRLGVRIVAQGPRTVYTDLVPSSVGNLASGHPGPEKVRALLERLAYAQYQTRELEDWSTLESLLALHGITGDW